jgi:integrase
MTEVRLKYLHSFRGLRSKGERLFDPWAAKDAGNALAEADGTEREIMVRLGHKSPQMAAHYTKRASQKKLARSAVEKLERAKAVR